MRAVSFVLGRDWTVRTCTGDAPTFLGLSCADLEGNSLPLFLRRELEPVLAEAFRGAVVPNTLARIDLPTGESLQFSVTAAPAAAPDAGGSCERIFVVVEDRLHLERALLAFRQVSRTLALEHDPARIIRAVCRILVEARGYTSVLLVLVDEQGGVTDFAQAGIGDAFVPVAENLARGVLPGCCLEARSFDTAFPVRDRARICSECPLGHGCPEFDVLGVDLRHGDARLGYLVVSLSRGMAEYEGEYAVLEGLAADVAVALSRARAEEEHKRSEDRFRALVEGTTDAIFVQIDHRFAYLNPAAVSLFGVSSASELVGTPVLDRFHPSVHDVVRERIHRLNHLREPVPPFEEVWFRADGSEFPVDVFAVPVEFEGRLGALVHARDLTERKAAEEQRRRGEIRFRTTLYSIGDAVITADAHGRAQVMNPAAEQLTGWSESEAAGRPLSEVFRIVNEETRETVESPVDRVIRENKVVGLANHTVLIARDGTERPIADSGAPIPDEQGAVSGVVLVFRDQTTERELVASLESERQVLLDREAHLAAIYENAPLVLMLVDEERRVQQMNGYGPRFAPTEVADVIGLPWGKALRCLHSLEAPGGCGAGPHCQSCIMRATVEDTIRTGRPHDRVEASLPFLIEGQRKEATFLVSTTPLASHRRVLVSVMDITERRVAEQALQAERDNLRAILEAAPVGLLLLDLSETVVKANRAAEHVFGIRLRDLVSRRCGDLLSCAHRHEDPEGCGRTRHCGRCPVFSAIRRALEQGVSTHDLEMEALVGTPGSAVSRWFSVTVEPLMLEGKPHAIAALLDITDRKNAAHALAGSEARARAMVEGLPLPIFVWRRTHEAFLLEDCNLAARKAFGEVVVREVGRSLRELSAPLLSLFENVESCFQQQTSFRKEVKATLLGGDRTLVVTHGFVPPDRVLVHVDDVTDRRRAESAVRTSQRLEAIGQLAGGVAHDFNNLLLVINGNTDFVIEALSEDDPARRDLLEIRHAGRRAADLTRQLLAYSRRQLLEPRVLDLNDVIIPLQHMLRRLVGEHIDLKIQTSAQPAVVKADPGQLEQVVVNLAVNARDAMPDGGTLLIETAIEGDGGNGPSSSPMPGTDADYVRLSVVDSGVGMDAVTRDRVFEPFFTTKEVGKGTGLGLATVYGIVSQSEGFVRVESEEGRGTAFHILLPRQSLTVPPQRDTLVPAQAEQEAIVLVVEDERAVRQLAERILSRAGYRVMTAASGSEALALVQQQDTAIQLLLTDVVMPNMSGRQLADAMTVRYPDLRVLYMSGYTDNAIIHHGVLDSGIHFIGKPFSASALTRKVREVLAEVAESSDA